MLPADVVSTVRENPHTAAWIATGLVTAGVAIYVATRPRRSTSKNPFRTDSRQPAKEYESDKSKRDAVLKNGYSEAKLAVAGDKFDAIVIGSGIGGLTTASILARAGKKVLVLEQHDQCGGCCHSFTEKGYEFDTGIHYIGECRNNTGELKLHFRTIFLTLNQYSVYSQHSAFCWIKSPTVTWAGPMCVMTSILWYWSKKARIQSKTWPNWTLLSPLVSL
jgi:hypothetical protein